MRLTVLQRKKPLRPFWAWIISPSLNFYPVKKIYLGNEWGDMYAIFSKDTVYWAVKDEKKINKLIKNIHKELKRNPSHIEKVRKEFDKRSIRFKEFLKKLKKKDFSNSSKRNLWLWYNKIIKEYKRLYIYGEPLAWLAKDATEIIRFNGTKEEFNILITQPEMTFTQRERLSLLKVYYGKKTIEKHMEEFRWIPYDYGASTYNKKHFLRELKEIRKDPIEEYKYLSNYKKIILKKQNDICKKYNIDMRLFKVIQHGAYLMDYKKELFTKCHLYSDKLFTKISKTLKIKRELSEYILPYEMKGILLNNKNIPDLKKRFDSFAFLSTSDGKMIIYENADNLLEKINVKVKLSELKGTIAYPGHVTGKARVLLDSRDKIKKDEILVTSMTSPDYLPAIKKAKAIITDEGGITSHAAIVARELKIPCIVGTKVATKAIKTGDKIEMKDGMIKIIN